ncbi:nuclear transport factor 2 family protein [Novosphingobium sp. KCTC 2891]|uniref:nuclear transport factor 2 family protein n=1 Tax=Novosphingobium sp. KCTC 2891 TaxID=2989730 RepID=UPI0022233D70|nr:nuclear transport factor 2 family protein [Novosphingobium sp. KCTC 2891]MCW1383610.1 nuclear transport factor 2 family protein [Novosphingobium sp. KCTC 2891]
MEPIDVVKSAYDAILSKGDLEGFLACFADDGVLLEADSLPYGGRFTGRDAIRGAMLKVIDTYSAFSFTPDVFTTSGEWVIAYGTFSVTARTTGKSVSFPLAEVSQVVGGKIKLIHPVYGDTAAIVEALR